MAGTREKVKLLKGLSKRDIVVASKQEVGAAEERDKSWSWG